MTRDNGATFRRYHELLNETGDIAVEFLDPDVEMRMFRGSPIPGPYRGRDGVRQFEGYRELPDALAAAGIEPAGP